MNNSNITEEFSKKENYKKFIDDVVRDIAKIYKKEGYARLDLYINSLISKYEENSKKFNISIKEIIEDFKRYIDKFNSRASTRIFGDIPEKILEEICNNILEKYEKVY